MRKCHYNFEMTVSNWLTIYIFTFPQKTLYFSSFFVVVCLLSESENGFFGTNPHPFLLVYHYLLRRTFWESGSDVFKTNDNKIAVQQVSPPPSLAELSTFKLCDPKGWILWVPKKFLSLFLFPQLWQTGREKLALKKEEREESYNCLWLLSKDD